MTQKDALQIMSMGFNVYLTGPAGSGKTFLLNKYIAYLKSKRVKVAVTASTGIAATHMEGITIHSWSGIGIRDSLSSVDLKNILSKKKLKKKINETEVLIIDEISMLHAYQFDMVDLICRTAKKCDCPFGGIQIICSGDFFQLPPVFRRTELEKRFISDSNVWKEMGLKVCYLHEQHRQEKDNDLLKVLNDIRSNNVREESLRLLLSRKFANISSKIGATKLYSHNMDVDRINKMELDKMKGREFSYSMRSKGPAALIVSMKKGCLAPEKLFLKEGALVMFVKNNFEKGYVNGTLGRVAYFNNNDIPIVKTFSGNEIKADLVTWVFEENGKIIAEITQLPLRLAWAVTIHKSQGMSLDAAEIDLGKAFVEGMGYVALSRVRSLNGIRLVGLNCKALETHSEVLELDRLLLDSSCRVDKELKNMGPIERALVKKHFLAKCRG